MAAHGTDTCPSGTSQGSVKAHTHISFSLWLLDSLTIARYACHSASMQCGDRMSQRMPNACLCDRWHIAEPLNPAVSAATPHHQQQVQHAELPYLCAHGHGIPCHPTTKPS